VAFERLADDEKGIAISDALGGREARTAYGKRKWPLHDRPSLPNAAEIRLRAERRLGEMMIAQKETVGLSYTLVGK
jgi:hypothetical protein